MKNLFPAYAACTSIDDWKAADALHPAAIDGVDPVQYAMTVCAGNQEELGDTPICKAVNAHLPRGLRSWLPGPSRPARCSAARRSQADRADSRRSGKLRRPKGSLLHIRYCLGYRRFFGRAMPESGWSKDGVSNETGLFFQKGNLMIVVIIGDGKFSLMGS